jgi:hypothetical protein
LAARAGQDIGLAVEQAGFRQGANQANLGASLQQRGMNDAASQYYTQAGLNLDEQQRQAQMLMEQMKLQQALGYESIRQKDYSDAAEHRQGAMAGATKGAGALMSLFSDERLKTDVRPGDEKVEALLETIGAHDYRYKNEEHGKGRFVSPMAQELERTELGKALVEDTPEGKVVHYGRAVGTMLSAQANLHKRLRKLEAENSAHSEG